MRKIAQFYDLHDVNNLKLCNFASHTIGSISSLRKRWSRDKIFDVGNERDNEQDQESTEVSSDEAEPKDSRI